MARFSEAERAELKAIMREAIADDREEQRKREIEFQSAFLERVSRAGVWGDMGGS